jgi:hypothetical protein
VTLVHVRAFALMAFGLVLIVGLARCGDDRHPLAVQTAGSPCLVRNAPSPCDGPCKRVPDRRAMT